MNPHKEAPKVVNTQIRTRAKARCVLFTSSENLDLRWVADGFLAFALRVSARDGEEGASSEEDEEETPEATNGGRAMVVTVLTGAEEVALPLGTISGGTPV